MKSRQTGKYINYHSQHPLSQKRSIVYGLIDRTLLLSHSKFQEKHLIINILLNNCFPLPFIFATINTRIKMLINSNRKKSNDHCSQKKNRGIFLPFHTLDLFLNFFLLQKSIDMI